jgi:hypothetical protein
MILSGCKHEVDIWHIASKRGTTVFGGVALQGVFFGFLMVYTTLFLLELERSITRC